MRLDHTTIHRRRVELQISRRALAEASGLSWAALEHIEDRGYHANLTLEGLTRLAHALSLDPVTLIEPKQHSAPTSNDVEILGALLARHRKGLATSQATTALSWTPARLESALEQLGDRLAAVGQAVRCGTDTVRLMPGESLLKPGSLTAAERHLTELDVDHARVLLKVARGSNKNTYWSNFTSEEHPRLRTLIAQGLIDESAERVHLSGPARRSLGVH